MSLSNTQTSQLHACQQCRKAFKDSSECQKHETTCKPEKPEEKDHATKPRDIVAAKPKDKDLELQFNELQDPDFEKTAGVCQLCQAEAVDHATKLKRDATIKPKLLLALLTDLQQDVQVMHPKLGLHLRYQHGCKSKQDYEERTKALKRGPKNITDIEEVTSISDVSGVDKTSATYETLPMEDLTDATFKDLKRIFKQEFSCEVIDGLRTVPEQRQVLLQKVNGKLIGFAISRKATEQRQVFQSYLDYISVDVDWRGKSYGSDLLSRFAQENRSFYFEAVSAAVKWFMNFPKVFPCWSPKIAHATTRDHSTIPLLWLDVPEIQEDQGFASLVTLKEQLVAYLKSRNLKLYKIMAYDGTRKQNYFFVQYFKNPLFMGEWWSEMELQALGLYQNAHQLIAKYVNTTSYTWESRNKKELIHRVDGHRNKVHKHSTVNPKHQRWEAVDAFFVQKTPKNFDPANSVTVSGDAPLRMGTHISPKETASISKQSADRSLQDSSSKQSSSKQSQDDNQKDFDVGNVVTVNTSQINSSTSKPSPPQSSLQDVRSCKEFLEVGKNLCAICQRRYRCLCHEEVKESSITICFGCNKQLEDFDVFVGSGKHVNETHQDLLQKATSLTDWKVEPKELLQAFECWIYVDVAEATSLRLEIPQLRDDKEPSLSLIEAFKLATGTKTTKKTLMKYLLECMERNSYRLHLPRQYRSLVEYASKVEQGEDQNPGLLLLLFDYYGKNLRLFQEKGISHFVFTERYGDTASFQSHTSQIYHVKIQGKHHYGVVRQEVLNPGIQKEFIAMTRKSYWHEFPDDLQFRYNVGKRRPQAAGKSSKSSSDRNASSFGSSSSSSSSSLTEVHDELSSKRIRKVQELNHQKQAAFAYDGLGQRSQLQPITSTHNIYQTILAQQAGPKNVQVMDQVKPTEMRDQSTHVRPQQLPRNRKSKSNSVSKSRQQSQSPQKKLPQKQLKSTKPKNLIQKRTNSVVPRTELKVTNHQEVSQVPPIKKPKQFKKLLERNTVTPQLDSVFDFDQEFAEKKATIKMPNQLQETAQQLSNLQLEQEESSIFKKGQNVIDEDKSALSHDSLFPNQSKSGKHSS